MVDDEKNQKPTGDQEYEDTVVNIEGRRVTVRTRKVPPLPDWTETEIVGKALPRVDGIDKITGRAKYTYDIQVPYMLYAVAVRSPHPHARVKNISADKALAAPGVHGVMLPQDVASYTTAGLPLLTLNPKYTGEEIAVVAAETELQAEDAARLVKVEYEELPFVMDAELSKSDKSPVKFFPEGNFIGGGFGRHPIGKPSVYSRGDVEQGFKDSDQVFEETFTTQPQQHSCMEVHGTLAQWDDDQLTVWESTQGVYGVQEEIARVFKIPLSSIRVIGTHMGGGFGSKGGAGKQTALAVMMAKRTRRPVKMMLSRHEDYMGVYRPASTQYFKIGVKNDGRLMAIQLKTINPVGAYQSGANWGSCAAMTTEMYACPNVHTEEYAVFTNAPTPSAMRGPGNTQNAWGLEQMMDLIAYKLNLDPIEVRNRNDVKVDQVTNEPYASKGLAECYKMGAEKFSWEEKRRRRNDPAGTKKHGVGVASQIWGGGGGPPATAIVKINQDGSVNLLTGAADIGTGTRTVLSQICAEELGVPVNRIHVTNADTETTPYTLPSYGSITLASSGPAVRSAANDAKKQLFDLAAGSLGVKPDELSSKDGFIFVTRQPDKRMKFESAAAGMPERDLVGRGYRGPNPKGQALNAFGAQFCEVEVDTQTGEVRVLKFVAAHDSGRVINPHTFASQVKGGITMGTGYALSERRLIDGNTGIPVAASMLEYRPPTSLDAPIDIEVYSVDVPYKANNIGAKGVGEPPLIATAPAIANAVFNAVGVRIYSNPITPEKIMLALRDGKTAKQTA
ncbi:MAG: xanthine dehydrogenase family protein molybdopterin-binding subunit [Acidobacteriia bacterium]|nr:xanthine dehydrogenase family protein molybdopterin-binding subunit [Terriglobia bacterium]